MLVRVLAAWSPRVVIQRSLRFAWRHGRHRRGPSDGVGGTERIRRLFYNAYLGLVLVIEDGPRCYEDKSTVEWGRGLLERASIMLDHGDVRDDLLAYA